MTKADNKKEMIRINRLPQLTWHRLKVNDTAVRLPEQRKKAACRAEIRGNAKVTETSGAALLEIHTGMGEGFSEWILAGGIGPLKVSAGKDDSLVRLHIEASPEDGITPEGFVLPVEIFAKAGESLTVIMDLKATKNSVPSVFAVQTRIRAEEGSFIKLVQLQLTGKNTYCYTDIGADLKDRARMEIVQLFCGREDSFSGSEIRLSGKESSSEVSIGYLGSGNKKTDFNVNAVHIGRNTKSLMTVNGVLRDSSEKTFRGTIDFRTGSSGAVGAETEDVLLLGDGVVNRTIPLILCSEEDVQGSHGASIGQLDEEMLFYLGTRGIPEEKAVDLMAGARIRKIIRRIGDEAAEKAVLNDLGMETDE